ncbi:pre-mRNA-processing protein prp40 [Histoplasma capsulatum G186AR]|uniref:Pre-mRNA-processing protein prp40 n=1 Tax=Ajellomyces capsulatus TaxID=5037 RepID=A0A8H8D2V1_AJECA|nr:pre-mRNA-processing protein prp40 [Histoplasma capsulatum]QSS67658.1 pre-mRNA-processing protein prp40 [Histoplasma capsulatum G186AR]
MRMRDGSCSRSMSLSLRRRIPNGKLLLARLPRKTWRIFLTLWNWSHIPDGPRRRGLSSRMKGLRMMINSKP